MCYLKSKLNGKVAIVTGGSSGIGFETAKELAKNGARVIIASRNETKLKIAKETIESDTGTKDVTYKTLDLGSLESVRQFANEMYMEDRIDVLVNNAGAVGLPDRLTDDGLNLSMQVNYFGVFLLTYLLVPMLKLSSPSRIIIGTAVSMYLGEIDFDHWNDVGRYNAVKSLGNGKLADSLFMVELHEHLWNSGVRVNSFDPFMVRDTGILSNFHNNVTNEVSKLFLNTFGRKKEDVGAELAYLAASPEFEGVSGENLKFCGVSSNHWLVKDKEMRKLLWKKTKELVKITPKEQWD